MHSSRECPSYPCEWRGRLPNMHYDFLERPIFDFLSKEPLMIVSLWTARANTGPESLCPL